MNRRNSNYDNNRNLSETEMSTKIDIEDIKLAMINLQQKHQLEIDNLKKSIAAKPIFLFELTSDQIINKFQTIRPFNGKDDHSLFEFINAVENVTYLCNNNEQLVKHGMTIVLMEKLQGEARRCIHRLGQTMTWEDMKTELKIHFKPKKSYRKLMDECRGLKVHNLRELLNILRDINCQLNEVYELDNLKPSNFSPEINDQNLVEIVKEMIVGSYRINISRKSKLIDIVNIFEELELLDEWDVIHPKFRKNRENKNLTHNNSGINKKFSHNNSGQNGNFRHYNNSGQNRNFINSNNSGQNRNFVNSNNSGQYRNHNYNNSFHNQNFTNNSGQNNRNHNSSGQYRNLNNSNFQNNNHSIPMEVDNMQEDVNFLNEPQETDYQ